LVLVSFLKKRKPTSACLRIRLEGATLFVRYGNEEVNIRRINHTNKQTTESKYQPQTVLSSSVATIPRFLLFFFFENIPTVKDRENP